MSAMNASRMAMFEGIIALAWIDHVLSSEEQEALRHIFDSNTHFTSAQRAKLHADINKKATLAEVWPRITDKQDRAHLLDVAGFIFLKDGTYCASEKEVYDTFLAKHMATLDSAKIMDELHQLAQELRDRRVQEEQEIKEYAEQYSLVNRIKRYIENYL